MCATGSDVGEATGGRFGATAGTASAKLGQRKGAHSRTGELPRIRFNSLETVEKVVSGGAQTRFTQFADCCSTLTLMKYPMIELRQSTREA